MGLLLKAHAHTDSPGYMNKVVIKILQGNVVTQTVLGGLTIYVL